jgi:hypothetical protein
MFQQARLQKIAGITTGGWRGGSFAGAVFLRNETMVVIRISINSSATAAVAVRFPVFGFPTIIPD